MSAPVRSDLVGAVPRRNLKTSERIARDLVNYIIDHGLVEGTMLPIERDLVAQFGVGRTTLREALRLLETGGVITIRPGPHGGPVVRRPRPEDLREGLTMMLRFEGASLTDVLEAREAIEPNVARLAASRIGDDGFAALEETVQRMLDHLGDHDVFLSENARFHGLIAEFSGSAVLRVFVATLKSIADGHVVGVEYTEQRRKAVARAHARIIEGLRAGPDQADAAMREHLDEAGAFWRRRYSQQVSQPLRWVE